MSKITSFFTILIFFAAAIAAQAAPINSTGPWGIDAGGFKNLSTALASPATQGKVVVVSKPMTINNKTITGRVLKVIPGGSVTVASGKTLATNGNFEGVDGCFPGSGTVTGLKTAWPEMFVLTHTPDVTDMTSAIRAACGAKKLFLPGTTYKTTDGISCDSREVAGVGMGESVIHAATLGTGKTAMKFMHDDVYLRDFTVKGPAGGVYVPDETGIHLQGISGAPRERAEVSRVEVYNVGSYGILAEYFNKVTKDNVKVHDVGYMGIGGFSVKDYAVKSPTISNIGPGSSGDAYGISITNRINEAQSDGFLVDGPRIDGVLSWEAIDTHAGKNGRIVNFDISNSKMGVVATYDTASSTHRGPENIVIGPGTIRKGSDLSAPQRAVLISGYDDTQQAKNITMNNVVITDMGSTSDLLGTVFLNYTKGANISASTIANSVGNAMMLYNNNKDFSITGVNINGIQTGVANAAGIVAYSANQTGYIGDMRINASNEYGLYGAQNNPGIKLGKLDITTTNTPILTIAGFGPGGEAVGTTTTDVASMAAGGTAVFSVTVSGAVVGDYASVTSDSSTVNQSLVLTSHIGATNTAYVRLYNPTGSPVDPPSALYTVKVIKK